jgi:predicted PurR-regulated permease PerM
MNVARTNAAWQKMIPTLGTFVLVILAAACLYWASPVLIPLAMAMLISFMLSPAVTWLQRRGVPRTASVFVVISLAGVVLSAALWIVGSQVIQLVGDLPSYQTNVARKISEVREQGNGTLLRNLQRFVNVVTSAATDPTEATLHNENQPVSVTIVEQAAASSAAAWIKGLQPVAEPVVLAGGVLVLVIYLLIFRDDLRSRALALVGRGRLTVTTKALDDAGRRISRYLLAQFMLNFGFGIAITIGLLALRVPHAALWGFTAGLLRYIPYLGPWLAATLPLGMSLLVSEGWMQPLAVVGLFVVSELISNLIVEPWLYGQSIGVSQAALIVAVIFWTWLWGAVGLMLAAPLTTCLVVMGKYIPALRFLDVLLGDEPVLTPDVSLYQRLLARDEDDANEIVRKQMLTLPPLEICDQVLVPTLVHAHHDLQDGLLTVDEYRLLLSSIRSIAEEQDLAAVAADQAAEVAPSDSPPRPTLTILGCPSQEEAASTALTLLQQLLDPTKFNLEIVSANTLVSEVVEMALARAPAAVCIATLPAGGLAHTRYLCKRLHARAPDVKLLVCRWGAYGGEGDQEWATCNADYMSTSFADTIRQLEELAQFLRPVAVETVDPSAASTRIDTPHVVNDPDNVVSWSPDHDTPADRRSPTPATAPAAK